MTIEQFAINCKYKLIKPVNLLAIFGVYPAFTYTIKKLSSNAEYII